MSDADHPPGRPDPAADPAADPTPGSDRAAAPDPDRGPRPPPAAPSPPGRPPLRIGPALKLAVVAAILLLMLLPHSMIAGVIAEREGYQQEARAEIARAWGPAQTVLGPVLVVPTRTPLPPVPGDGGAPRWRRGSVVLPPALLRAEVELAPETRRRGLFEAVVFGARATLRGNFNLLAPELEADAELLWPDAFLLMGATDLRALDGDPSLSLDGAAPAGGARAGEAWSPPASGRAGPAGIGEAGCHGLDLLRWAVPLDAPPAEGRALSFESTLLPRGTGSFHLSALARRTEMVMTAPWPTPSFGGAALPVRSEVTATGFRAEWSDGGRAPVLRDSPCQEATRRLIGVSLLEAVPTYRMVSRASKYAAMFLALSFLVYALFELVAKVRIHPAQYGLLGASVVLFPLLLLALGEPLGFAAAYGISTAAVVAQASAYTASVTRRPGLAALFAAVLSALFGFLYVVLSLEAFALLAGAVALFAALSAVMLVTRRVDWSAAG